ncbi:MAG: hypothetical protein AB7U82_26870 [Blastocatellales bacterium]
MIRSLRDDQSLRRALIWLAVFAAIGAALVLLYHDADQQDSGYHFLFARWAHHHPHYFIGVWARPLFTLAYFLPAQLGYPAAKFFTVIISLATAWQTFRVARQIKFDHAELAVPILFLQPSFFLLSSTVLTEPLFALVFVIALRLHLSGRIKLGMIVASLLILVRPEGFFIGVLWGLWILRIADCGLRIANRPIIQGRRWTDVWRRWGQIPQSAIRNPQWLLLASGMILWWLAAYLITRDPLWIIHDWPSDWRPDGKANGTGPLWWYIAMLPLIVGPVLIAPFIAGLWRLLRRREFICGGSAFLVLFAAHSLMFWRGWFGSAGYARYFVCVSPAIALITLAGWNDLAERRAKFFNTARSSFAASVIAVSFLICVFYVDGWRFTRDARAVEEMREWFRDHERPVARLICSQAYMRIVFDRDQWEKPAFTGDRERNLELIRQLPRQTLIFWDDETGPKWYGLRAEDFESVGYVRLKSQAFKLEGWFLRLPWDRFGGPRAQRMHLLYKI